MRSTHSGEIEVLSSKVGWNLIVALYVIWRMEIKNASYNFSHLMHIQSTSHGVLFSKFQVWILSSLHFSCSMLCNCHHLLSWCVQCETKNKALLCFADGMMQELMMLTQRQVVPTVQLGMRKSINKNQTRVWKLPLIFVVIFTSQIP